MNSACVCHTDQWCFYCEMYVPLERERDSLAAALEDAKKGMPGYGAILMLRERAEQSERIQAEVEALRGELEAKDAVLAHYADRRNHPPFWLYDDGDIAREVIARFRKEDTNA